MSEQQKSGFFRTYNLTQAQKEPKQAAAHQLTALGRLQQWFEKKYSDAGSILVLPTGGGKTSTAMRFLCTNALSDGYKVLWLAHTHHLLEQAFYSLESEVRVIRGKQQLNVRVVSGTVGHFRPCHIQPNDDVVICTLQTVTRAYQNQLTQLQAFFKAAGNKLFVVFDEAHHSPAPSYCKFITELRKNCPGMYSLGLTATPTYTDERNSGWLKKLFPQGILYQISPETLMADGILAKPIFESSHTAFAPDFDEDNYKEWVRNYRDLPEDIITKLAENRERNAFIAKTYADNKERYGKTIVFADRWFQCEQLRDFLKEQKKGIRVGTVYSHIDADPGSADARNKRNKDENAKAIEAFRNNQLDVLINVRMLTEGTDIPNVNTVFLTRQTTSKILLTQMVGRALRGTKFGGTQQAYIVSFIDNWQHLINWAGYDPLEETPTADDVPKVSERLPIQLISIDLVRRLIRQINSGVNINSAPFLTLMPIGWYRVELEMLTEGNENIEIVQRLVMVFENEKNSYNNFIQFIKDIEESELEAFVEPTVSFDGYHQQRVERLQESIFSNSKQHIGGDLLLNLFYIVCHIAQNDRETPVWFDFEQRQEHNLDNVAQRFIDERLSRLEEDEKLGEEYNREDRYWTIIYYSYELFKSQYNACVEWLLATKHRGTNPEFNPPTITSKRPPAREPSEEIKQQVKQRDNYRCVCCGNPYKLEIDHIHPKYYGGEHSLDNLQTLCKTCHGIKELKTINFLARETPLKIQPINFPNLELPKPEQVNSMHQWEYFLRRTVNFLYRCEAVKSVKLQDGWATQSWEISLYAGNDPRWLKQYREELQEQIRRGRERAKLYGQVEIIITAPKFDVL